MAHRSCAAALHATRMVMKFNQFTIRPPETLVSGAVHNLTASEAHISIIIDKATQAYEIAKLRPELRHWQLRMTQGNATAPQIAQFLKRCVEVMDLVPPELPSVEQKIVSADAPSWGAWSKMPLSAASLEAARRLFHYYFVTLLSGDILPENLHRVAVAKIIDVSLGLAKAMKAAPRVRACLDSLRKGNITPEDVQRYLRTIGILLECLPNYEEREDEVKLLVS